MSGSIAAWRSIAVAPRLSPDELRLLQWRRLEALIAHAYARSSFYRQRFAASGIQPRDIQSLEDFAQVPLTTRSDLHEPDALIADGYARRKLKSSTTSGSTGQPTTTCFDARAWLLSKYLLKLRARHACGMRAFDRVALFQEAVRDGRPGRLARRHAFTIHQPPQATVDSVARYAPTILYGFPGYLLRLGEIAGGRIRPRLVFTSSELLDGQTRRGLEKSFGAPVLDVYGSSEVKEIAWQCPRRAAYHLNSDWLVFETVDTGGSGTRGIGRVVITPLFNYAMPLLRYDLGDTGEIVDESCPCGLGLPLVRPVYGRDVDYFRLAGGEEITPYDLTCAIEKIPGMLRYQIVQRSIHKVEVRVVPGRDFNESSSAGIRRALRDILRGLEAEVHLVEKVEPERNGKFRIVKSDVRRDAAPPPAST